MIRINARGDVAGDFLGDLARVEGLAHDLALLFDGYRPDEVDLESAPILDQWSLALAPTPRLLGRPHGHPYCRGPRSITSPVFVLAPDLGWARTLSRYYRLGRPRGAGNAS